MVATDPRLELIRRNLRVALGLELFVEFSFVVALAATLGAFNRGLPTTTPALVPVYLVVGFLVTIVVAIRTRQMLAAATRGDVAALRKFNISVWAVIAIVFSAMLPSIYLNVVAADVKRL